MMMMKTKLEMILTKVSRAQKYVEKIMLMMASVIAMTMIMTMMMRMMTIMMMMT